MKYKKITALILSVIIILSASPLNIFIDVFAGLSPYDSDYGRGTYSDPADYRQIHPEEFSDQGATAPTARFSILDPNGNTLITSSDTAQTLSLFLGDKVTFKDNSILGSGDNFTKYDFQISHRGSVTQLTAIGDIENPSGFTFDDVGEYNIYFNVMDDTPKEKTDYWGNWSYNGSHIATGLNPGKNDKIETTGTPETAGGDDFWGYWYFVEIKVIVSPHTLTETHYDIDTGRELSKTVYNNITSSEYATYSKTPQQLPGYTYMGSKAGYTWSEADSSPLSDATVTSRRAKYGYVNYAENKGSNNAFHWYYYKKLSGLHPNFAIKYSGTDYTDKELTVPSLPVTVSLTDLSVGENITSWTWKYKTEGMSSFETFSIAQNPTKELDAEKTYTFRLTVKNAIEEKSVEHSVNVKKGTPSGPTDKPPIAVIDGPSSRMAGENTSFSGASSIAYDGKKIESLIWEVPGATINNQLGKTISVWYPREGEYDVSLTVVDSAGLTGECMTSIKITPPIPKANIDITGTFKENRKVTVSGVESSSPVHYPINKYTWSMTNGADARYIGSFGSDVSKDMIFKNAQSYNFGLTVNNTYGLSNSTNKGITIVPDIAPIADFTVTTPVLRNKDDGYATLSILNNSRSTDGDTIKKTIMFYAYDSNNDGNFENETWYMSKDGTTWAATGLNYSQLNNFDLYNLTGAGNPENFVLKTKNVGKYKFEAMTMEDIPDTDTIPELLNPEDYKTSITTTSKPSSAKIIEVINTAPGVSFEVKKKKPVDIFIFTDYTGTKLNNLQGEINANEKQLKDIGIEPNFVIVNTSKTIGSQVLKKYKYTRNLHFNILVTNGDGTNNQWTPSSPKRFDATDGVIWEEKESYEKPLNEIPFGRNYSYYQYINTTTRSSPYEATTRNYKVYDTAGGYEDVSFSTYYNYMGYYYNYRTWSITGVGPDSQWTQGTYLGTDNLNVTSIDLDSIRTIPLRNESDRFAIFLSDGKSKDYSAAYGDNFAFGTLTGDLKNYITQNNFKVYTIADPKSMNTIIDKEIGVDVLACDAYQANYNYRIAMYQDSNGRYYFYHTKTNKPYIIDSSTFGEVKSLIYPGFVLMKNGTTKHFNGTSFANIPINNIISVQPLKNNSYHYALITKNRVYIVYIYNDCEIKATIPVTDVISISEGRARNDGDDYDYYVIAAKNSVIIVKYDTLAILGTFPQNNFQGVNVYNYESIVLADSDGIDVIRTANMKLFRSFAIPGGMKQLYPKDSEAYYYDGSDGHRGVFALSNNGKLYFCEDTDHPDNGCDGLIDKCRAAPAVFNPYTIECIPEYIIGFYLRTTDKKLLAYNRSTNSIAVRYSSFSVVEESINENQVIVKLADGSIKVKYPIDVGGYLAVRDFYDLPIPSGITVKQIINTSCGMFLLDDNNGLYKITYNLGEGIDQSPRLSLYKSGVSSLIKDASQNLFFKLTNGSIYHEEYRSSSGRYYRYNTRTYNDVKRIAITDNGGYFLLYNNGTSNNNIISTNITMTNPSADYITLSELSNSNYDNMAYGAGQYSQALNHLTGRYTADPSYTTNYIVLGDTVHYNIEYDDWESDPEYRHYWTYSHDSNYFENSMGKASFSGQTLNTPITTFNKVGKYTINLKVKDNPLDDDKFDNYRLPNEGVVEATLYVHRLGVPVIKPIITQNGSYWKIEVVDGGSYDLDHISRADKGIVAREWRWKEQNEVLWHSGRMIKSDCLSDETYQIQLRVKDVEGFWSDWKEIRIENDNPPSALFYIEKNPLPVNEKARIKDLSYPQSLSTLIKWHWIVKKFNEDDTLPSGFIHNVTWDASNEGTGEMKGYDICVKTDYEDTGPGKYRIYLRVKDSNGLWSDGGTDDSYNPDNMFNRDLIVNQALEIEELSVQGRWNHFRGWTDKFGVWKDVMKDTTYTDEKGISRYPYRHLSYEKIDISIKLKGYANMVIIDFPDGLGSMNYRDKLGYDYSYKEDVGYTVSFPLEIPIDPSLKDPVITWEYILPLVNSSASWENIRLKQPYTITVKAIKGSHMVTQNKNIDITGNIDDLIFIQPVER